MTIRTIHRYSALIISAFALLHLTNHLWAWGGVEAHTAFLTQARLFYRNPVSEGLLLLAILLQVGTGGYLVYQQRKTRVTGWDRVQRWAGIYLLLFLLGHTTAVLIGRFQLALDTNFHFASVVLLRSATNWFFYPYYALAILALFAHLGTGLRWYLPATKRNQLPWISLGLATVIAVGILFVFGGHLFEIEIPAGYESVTTLWLK